MDTLSRPRLILVAALLALVGSLVALFSTIQERDFMLRGYVDATRSADLPFRLPLLGVNVELAQYTPQQMRAQFALMRQARITWVRQFVRWDEIEPARGVYDWSLWDQITHNIADYPDLQIVAVLVNSPGWSRSSGRSVSASAPPDNAEDFAAFAHVFAERYGQSIDYYQIWDEPNLTAAWGDLQPRPAAYAGLLQTAYAAIHHADERATVIAAALAPTVERGPQNISDIIYLETLYRLGARDFTDAIAAKPYGFDSSPLERTVSADTLNFSRIVALREVMLRYDDGQTALWASAFGWNSLPDSWTGAPSIWGSVSADQRTQYTLSALNRVQREWPWLGGLILQHWQPPAPADDPQWGFALVDPQQQPTPLWTALVQRPQPDGAIDGLYPAANPFARYSGVWTFGALGADIGWVRPTDSSLEFTFSGTDVALRLRQDDYVAYLYPTVDGQPANAVPRAPDGTAYIVLTSDTLTPQTALLPVARSLPAGTHILRVVADRGEDRWALAAYAVSSGDLAAPYHDQITAAIFTAFTAAAAVIVSARQIDWQAAFRRLTRLWNGLSETAQLVFSAITSLALLVGMLLSWGDTVPSLFRRDEIPLVLVIASAGLLRLELHFLLNIAALLVLFFVIYQRLDFGLLLTVFWAPFFLFPVELYRFAFPLAELMILLTSAAALLRLLVAWGRQRQSFNPRFPLTARQLLFRSSTALDWAVVAWVILGCLSLFWAQYSRPAVTELRTMVIEPALFYIIFRALPADRKTLLRLVDTLLLTAVAVALVGLYLYGRGEAVITAEEGARRLASVYGSPNNVGLFLGRCIPFVLAFVLIPTHRRRRIAAALLLLMLLLTVALTQSVGALFIGLPAAFAAALLAVWGRRAWLALIGLAGLGALAAPFLLQFERFARVFDFSQGTNFYRIRVWQSALNAIRDFPLTGLGLDQFLYAFRGHYIIPDAWQEPNLSHPHNFLLDWWVRLGVFGVLLFLWTQFVFWRLVRRLYRDFRHDRLFFALTVGLIGSMVNLLAHGLVDHSVYVPDLALVYALLLGLAAQLSNIRAIDDRTEMMV
ncbi:MAG: O-antigen ligase family protein [Chloroflexi bacterium]|nr:O-antigen ligase family protein [Chloroflexota bacterium]